MLTRHERKLITRIKKETEKSNLDNVSRTQAYLSFFRKHPEIKWSFLAHMVSRNAGWNMCDLEGQWMSTILKKDLRRKIFFTYEQANWLIFQDAFPQLLLYHYSTKFGIPLFHLLKYFYVSCFMEKEWYRFWATKERDRLLYALIINEQNVIEMPVIRRSFFKEQVFSEWFFTFQEGIHFSAVLFPTLGGELFGTSVNHFRDVDKRIQLGKTLAKILFHPKLFQQFYLFAIKTTHTGSRYDYEQYMPNQPMRATPFLRTTYPIVPHLSYKKKDWSEGRVIKKTWFSPYVKLKHPIHLTEWYLKKQTHFHLFIMLTEFVNRITNRK